MAVRVAYLKSTLRFVLAVAMVSVGVMHFVGPAPFVRIIPAGWPMPLALVLISGFFEIAGGLGLLVPQTRRAAAWGLIALYIAVFPANINMAVNHIALGERAISPALLWARLPLQGVLIALAYWFTRADSEGAAKA